MSRTRRIFLIAALIVFGLLVPGTSDANLTHCGGPWQGTGDTVESTCRFRFGGGAVGVAGLATGLPSSHLKVELYQYPVAPFQTAIVTCSGSLAGAAQCSTAANLSLVVGTQLICKVHGVALAGVYSCRTV